MAKIAIISAPPPRDPGVMAVVLPEARYERGSGVRFVTGVFRLPVSG